MQSVTTTDVWILLAIMAGVLYGLYRLARWVMRTARDPGPQQGPHSDRKMLIVRRYWIFFFSFLAVLFLSFSIYWFALFFRYIV